MYAAERGCLTLVWPLAPPRPTERLIVWDLAADRQLFALDAATPSASACSSPPTELPEGVQRLPLKTIHLNKSPVVVGNLKTLSPALAERWGVDVAQACAMPRGGRGAGRVAGLWPRCSSGPRRRRGHRRRRDLYGGFIGNSDRGRLQRLRDSRPSNSRASASPSTMRGWRRSYSATARATFRRRCRQTNSSAGNSTAASACTVMRCLGSYFDRIDALNERQ